MEARFSFERANPEAVRTMLKFEGFVKESGLDKKLYELVKIRASQMNGCAFCLDLHTADARKMGETEQRLYLLSVWREAPFYTERERAALELTEAVTNISSNGVPQDVYERVRGQFDEGEYVALVMAINTINAWNRLALSTGMVPKASS